jgi:hypothetical protein
MVECQCEHHRSDRLGLGGQHGSWPEPPAALDPQTCDAALVGYG